MIDTDIDNDKADKDQIQKKKQLKGVRGQLLSYSGFWYVVVWEVPQGVFHYCVPGWISKTSLIEGTWWAGDVEIYIPQGFGSEAIGRTLTA